MRYRIKATDLENFRKVKQLASQSTRVYVESEKRLMLGTGDLPSNALALIRASGATVIPDRQYVPDAV